MALFSNKKNEALPYIIKDHQLICPVCQNDHFTRRKAQLNTAVASFFNLDWTNKEAHCFVCSNCSHILWFHG